MDVNIVLIEWWAGQRLEEVRAAALREQLVESLRQRPPLRVLLGRGLISLGRRLQGDDRPAADALTAQTPAVS